MSNEPKPVKTLRITIQNDETGEVIDVQKLTDGWTIFVNGCFKVVGERQVGARAYVTIENQSQGIKVLSAAPATKKGN